jgi:hypothetical protein
MERSGSRLDSALCDADSEGVLKHVLLAKGPPASLAIHSCPLAVAHRRRFTHLMIVAMIIAVDGGGRQSAPVA